MYRHPCGIDLYPGMLVRHTNTKSVYLVIQTTSQMAYVYPTFYESKPMWQLQIASTEIEVVSPSEIKIPDWLKKYTIMYSDLEYEYV